MFYCKIVITAGDYVKGAVCRLPVIDGVNKAIYGPNRTLANGTRLTAFKHATSA